MKREQGEAADVAKAALAVAKQRLRRRWGREGHDPYRHMRGITATGDATVLHAFYTLERAAAGNRGTAYFALTDILDLARALRVAR